MDALYRFKQKHAKLLMTLLIFIVIPTAAGFAFGYEMGYNKIQLIPTVIADYDNSEFSRTLAEYIGDSEVFTIAAYAASDEEAENMIADGRAMTAVIIPQGLSADMLSGAAPKIEVLYDGTMMTVASSAKAAMSEILMTVKAGYMKNIYEGKLNNVESQAMNQIMPIDATYRTLFNPAKNYRNFLLPGMLSALMQVGFAIMGLAKSMEARGSMGNSVLKDLCFSVARIVGWGFLGAVSLVLCLGIQYRFFSMPYEGSLAAGMVFTFLFATAMTAFGYLMGQIIPDKVFATQLTCVLVLPTSILGGYTFPLMAMPPLLQQLGKVFPLSYYGDGIRRLCLAQIGFDYFVPDFIALLKIIGGQLAVLAVVLIALKYKKRAAAGRGHEHGPEHENSGERGNQRAAAGVLTPETGVN